MRKILSLVLIWIAISGCYSEPQKRGGAVFYTTSNSYGQITISVNGSSFIVPVSTNPDRICEMGYTGFIWLPVGSHTYKAVSQNGRTWEGTVIVVEGFPPCTLINFN